MKIKSSQKIILGSLLSAILPALVMLMLYQYKSVSPFIFVLCAFTITAIVFGISSLFIFRKILYGRLDETIKKVRKYFPVKELVPFLKSGKSEEDPIDRFNEEILHLANERQNEVEQLQKLERYRKEFLGNVSHELKTPIFNIQGYLSTLIDGGLEDPKINLDYLNRADKSVDRMIQIIDDLETISQLETGTLSLELEKFNLTELVKDVCYQIEIQAAKKNIKIIPDARFNTVKVVADRFRLRQVFSNLLSNSIKYGRQDGEISILLEPSGNHVKIVVADNGIGIEEKHLDRLFERFYRVDKGRSRAQGGTGLGLSIVKHILEAHQQSITVESKAGQGTKFIFFLTMEG